MIAVDTNVLVRYLVQDDPRQSAQAAKIIEQARAGGIFVSHIVMCELVWVLSFSYDVPRKDIASLLHQLRRAAGVVFESPDQLQGAIASYESGRGDLADYLIAERAIARGCSGVATFDKALQNDPRFFHPGRA
jgi:predicted nucleic-acid-binding protein